MAKYPILFSGFIGLNENVLDNNSLNEDSSILHLSLNKDYLNKGGEYFYSKELSELYNAWLDDINLIKNFEFRENLLRIAFKLFAVESIYKWINIQLSVSKTIGNLHEQFILEMLGYGLTGDRTINVNQWEFLLSPEESSTSVKLDIEKYFDQSKYPGYTYFKSSTITSFIQNWVSNKNGYEDLLISLHVIFGNRKLLNTSNN